MQLLPLVDEQRKKIDELFVEFAGMFGFVVAEEQFALWRNSTSARPTELRIYIKCWRTIWIQKASSNSL